jgi:hypothetical protein
MVSVRSDSVGTESPHQAAQPFLTIWRRIDLAERWGVTPTTIGRWATNGTLPTETARAADGTPLGWLSTTVAIMETTRPAIVEHLRTNPPEEPPAE